MFLGNYAPPNYHLPVPLLFINKIGRIFLFLFLFYFSIKMAQMFLDRTISIFVPGEMEEEEEWLKVQRKWPNQTMPPDENGSETKYLLIQIPRHWEDCGGLANQMWRYAVLYSMARTVGRQPGILASSRAFCAKGNRPGEIKSTFPVLHQIFGQHFATPNENFAYQRHFEWICCDFVDPKKILSKYEQKYLIVPPPPQSYGYFAHNFDEIRRLFQFSDELRQIANKQIGRLFKGDRLSHKLCVHTRLRDFGGEKWPWHQPSTREFTEKAIEFVLADLKTIFPHMSAFISVVLLGEDKKFLKSLEFPLKPRAVYVPPPMDRAEDMCFAVHACHSLLITASSSTFAWWIAFLLRQQRASSPLVYFNADFSRSLYRRTNFMPEWRPIRLDGQGQIVMDHH